jgi:hypothetical protein
VLAASTLPPFEGTRTLQAKALKFSVVSIMSMLTLLYQFYEFLAKS